MSRAVRRGMPLLIFCSSIGIAQAEEIAKIKRNHSLLPTLDNDTAQQVREILRDRGWSDFPSPAGLFVPSISLIPPSLPASMVTLETIQCLVDAPNSNSDFGNTPDAGFPQGDPAVISQEEEVLEHFDGYVDSIEGGIAFVTLKSREHGDELIGKYSANLLNDKGIREQNRFVCRTLRVGNTTRVEIEAVAKVAVTAEQIREINEELNRMLPDDDSVDY